MTEAQKDAIRDALAIIRHVSNIQGAEALAHEGRETKSVGEVVDDLRDLLTGGSI